MDEISQIITATGTSVLAIGAFLAGLDYKRRLNIKRKSYLTRQVEKFNGGISNMYNFLLDPTSKEGTENEMSLKVFIYEVNALFTTTIFTSEALRYLTVGDTERVRKSKLHKILIFFNKPCANKEVVNKLNSVSLFIDNFYEKKINEKKRVSFKEILAFYLSLKGKIMEVSSAIR